MKEWQLTLLKTAGDLEDLTEAVVSIVVLQAVFGMRFVDPEEAFPDPYKDRENPLPAAGRTCDISVDGYVLTHWVLPSGHWEIQYLGEVERFRDHFRRLADRAKLDDDERIAFFADLRRWVREDKRPKAEGEWTGASRDVI